MTVSSPPHFSSHPAPNLALAGTADDLDGVVQVQIALKHRTTDTWYDPTDPDPSDGYGPGFRQQTTTLDSPGATSVNWSYDLNNLAAGDYGLTTSGYDSLGNRKNTFTRFTVTDRRCPGDRNGFSETSDAVLQLRNATEPEHRRIRPL